MKNFFILLIVFAGVLSFASCDNDSPASEQEFFNLKVGSQWSYKQYSYMVDTQDNYAYNGISDVIEVVDNISLNGIEFAKLKRIRTNENPGGSTSESFLYQRINEEGHLVGYDPLFGTPLPDDLSQITETSGMMFHPGKDISYENSNSAVFGTLFTHVIEGLQIVIEGNTYAVNSLVIDFTPPDATAPTRHSYSDYENKIGRVRSQYVPVSGSNVTEDRLVSFSLAE
ncbi:MAG TPA: hypothetical protein VGB50_11675 [Flavobacterium sp.]|jgi:hypothetical protein